MVSFSCEGCGDVLTKKKLDPHRNQCRGASFTCLDCMINFHGTEYRSHTSCISEAQKYQGALYRPEKEKKGKQNNQNNSKAAVPHKAYVEDAPDNDSYLVIVEPPQAPSPPSAVPGFSPQEAEDEPVNVFDYLVDASTPNTSRFELPPPEPMNLIEETPYISDHSRAQSPAHSTTGRELVRVRFDGNNQSITDLVEYGTGPVPSGAFVTPAPKERERERKKDKKDRDQTREEKKEKKDKKRKRLHVETQDLEPRGDEVMTDAPPVLHSGLTGGLGRLLSRPSVFPPSPDYSGGDGADASPKSPLKKTKHAKRGRVEGISQGFLSFMSGTRIPSRDNSEEHKRKHRRHRERSKQPTQKMLEYKPMTEDAPGESAQMVVYKPRGELLLSYVNKGPSSERGVSMNKALKRYHRDRQDMGIGLGKGEEEKELWRSLRMKKNDRGEIVLFML